MRTADPLDGSAVELRPLEPLWRGLLVYRILTLILAVIGVVRNLDDYASPVGVLITQAAMVVWTVITGWGYFPGPRDRRGWLVLGDLAVTVALMGTTRFVQTAQQLADHAPIVGSYWTSGPVLAAALAFGVRGGLGAALVVAATLIAVQQEIGDDLGDIQLLLLAGLSVGFAGGVLRRSAQRLSHAVAEEAAARERERLALAVHDGVLQVLGYVHRRGTELGGDAGRLGALAGEQEIALRTLLTSGSAPVVAGRQDLAAALRRLGTERVTVSTPAHPVELAASAVHDLVAVVTAALANVAQHVAPDAPAWVLVEDTGNAVQVSVRDAGPGIPAGRLAAAAAEGRIGVARSMQGRVRELGGTISCDTAPGQGTEWTVTLPRTDDRYPTGGPPAPADAVPLTAGPAPIGQGPTPHPSRTPTTAPEETV